MNNNSKEFSWLATNLIVIGFSVLIIVGWIFCGLVDAIVSLFGY